MDLTSILDALVVLLAAGSLGFLAYGGWLCVRHATKLDDATQHVPDGESLSKRESDTRKLIALD